MAVAEATPAAPAEAPAAVQDDAEIERAEVAEKEQRKAKVDLKEIRAKHEREKAGNA
jgi:hypothetical protein